jgi:hypothetical protein
MERQRASGSSQKTWTEVACLAQRLAEVAADILRQRRREVAEAKLRLLSAMCLAVACGPVDGSRARQQMEAAVEALRQACGLKGDVWGVRRVAWRRAPCGARPPLQQS